VLHEALKFNSARVASNADRTRLCYVRIAHQDEAAGAADATALGDEATDSESTTPDILENAEPNLTRNLIDLLWGEWKMVEQQIEKLSLELQPNDA
jgi:hypothetical protein